ncbi:MAG TPA: MBOAT family O-acyltransferase, partial [Chthoniobacteraceae bacterium]
FAVFLAVTVPVYFLLPLFLRPTWLVVTSYYFYMYVHPQFGWLLLACTIIAYLAGLALEHWHQRWLRRTILALALGLNLGLLCYFKYGDLLVQSLNQVASTDFSALHLMLPVGISFFTFQALSYCLDVYWKRFPAERRLDVFAAYKAFFPQLVAGPIERPANVIPQLKMLHRFDWDHASSGLQLMLWGFFKKLVIADRLAVLVKEVYAAPHHHSGLQLLLATYAFAFQIFCDFSAYTDMARGCGRILGIELMENFRAPYHARSIAEFWNRWHISLSTWFRDYLYIPLGGNRVQWLRWQFNLLLVFVVSGIWHGADWKFAIWGLLHATYFIAGNLLARCPQPAWLLRLPNGLTNVCSVFITFHLVVLAWVFFRADSVEQAFAILGRIFQDPLQRPLLTSSFGLREALIAAGGIILLEAVHLLHRRRNARVFVATRPLWVRWPAYYALILLVVVFGKQGPQEFIYFQF